MTVLDWRSAGRERILPLYETARGRWSDALGWDTSANWREIEQARTTWGLPGLLATDETGAVRGWLYFLPHGAMLQVGGIAADTPAATAALLDALVRTDEARRSQAIACFVFEEAPGLVPALVQHGFETEPFLYLSLPLDPGGPAPAPAAMRAGDHGWGNLRGFRCPPDGDDGPAAARLLHASYTPHAARFLVAEPSAAAWEQYVRSVMERTGLGVFDAAASRVLERQGRLDAVALVTALSPRTAHLAQVAVCPSRRAQGLASHLVGTIATHVAAQGFAALTLLVGASNAPARRLYDSLGFGLRARFVAGVWRRAK